MLWDGEVVPGFVDQRRSTIADDTRAIAEYNERVAAHPQLMTSDRPAARRRVDLGEASPAAAGPTEDA